MFNNSLKLKALQKIKAEYPDWVGGIVIERMAMDMRFKPSNVSRRLRELKQEGYLESKYVNGFVEYRYLPRIEPQLTSERLLQEAVK